MAKKKEEGHFESRVLSNILQFNTDLDSQLTSKSNFVFGASAVILMFVLNKILSKDLAALGTLEKLPWIILLLGTFLSSLLALMVVLPKIRIFSKKERIKEDVFYYKNIIKFYSRKSYLDYFEDFPSNHKKITDAYANQVYSLAKHILPYKFKMLKFAGWTMIVSVFLSVCSFIIPFLI